MNEKKATPNIEAAVKNLQLKFTPSNSAAAQRRCALVLLRTGPKTTIQLRRDGDILSPAARIFELRKRGFEIVTHWVQQATDCGALHRVALYALLRETGGRA